MANSGYGKSRLVSSSERCPICGKPDWCTMTDYPSGDRSYCCRRVNNPIGVIVNGYIVTRKTKDDFSVYETIEQAEKFKNRKFDKNDSVQYEYHPKKKEVEAVAELLPPEEQDRWNRILSHNLILEEKHKKKLMLEWPQSLYDSIMSHYDIKSMPPQDKIRFSSKEKLSSLSRKKIVEKSIEEFGKAPLGIRGMYQRGYDDAWQIAPQAGIYFPCYNSCGQLIGYRCNVDYPTVVTEKGEIRYRSVKDQATGWWFTPYQFSEENGEVVKSLDFSSSHLVWEYGNPNNEIELNAKGYPSVGKVEGKYKAISTYSEVEFEGKFYNKYKNGVRSTSLISLYDKASTNYQVVYITEGEKKGIVCNEILHVPCISLPGVQSFSRLFEKEDGREESMIESLKKKGMVLCVLAYDADKENNMNVLKAERKAIQMFIDAGIRLAIAEWNIKFGKGLDDNLISGHLPNVIMIQ